MSRLLSILMSLTLALVMSAATLAEAQGYRLGSGDVVRVEILEDPSLNRSLLIAPDGRISVPLAGGVAAAGRTLEAIRSDVTARLASNFAAPPTVYVALERRFEPRLTPQRTPEPEATMDLFVVGEANRPGRLQVPEDTNVLQAIAQMGGFTKFAAKKRLQLRRDGKIYSLNYKAIEAGSSAQGGMMLQDGDVLVVPQRRLFE